MVSEKQKQYARKWDKENMRSVTCRLRREDAELFKEYCTAHNTTPAAILKKFVMERLDEYSAELKRLHAEK